MPPSTYAKTNGGQGLRMKSHSSKGFQRSQLGLQLEIRPSSVCGATIVTSSDWMREMAALPAACCVSVITVPWMLQYTSHYRCYNRISAGSSWSDVLRQGIALSHTHTHTHTARVTDTFVCRHTHTHTHTHICTNKNKCNSLHWRITGFSETMCFGSVAAEPVLCGMNHFISANCCRKLCELFMSQT